MPKVEIVDLGNRAYQARITDAEWQQCDVVWYGTEGQKDMVLGKGEKCQIEHDGLEQLRVVVTHQNGHRTMARMIFQAAALPELRWELATPPASLGFGEELSFKVTGAQQVKDLVIRVRYIPPTGHDAGGPSLDSRSAQLIESKQCLACHQVDANSVGPSYLNVAMRYRDDAEAKTKLWKKLREGGAGAWGEIPMPAQSAVNEAEANEIIQAILGLSRGMAELRSVAEGRLVLPAALDNAAAGGAWELVAEAPMHTSAKWRIPAK